MLVDAAIGVTGTVCRLGSKQSSSIENLGVSQRNSDYVYSLEARPSSLIGQTCRRSYRINLGSGFETRITKTVNNVPPNLDFVS